MAKPRIQPLADAKRVLLLGMGGGGDVVGALALTELIASLGVEWVLGGVAWERSPIDPRPGPRSLEEIRGGSPCGPAAVLASAETTTADGIPLSESRMAEHLGQAVLLLDITGGAQATGAGIAHAAGELGCDLVLMVDVGGDVLARGSEPGLASPLCDAIMLAAAVELPAELRALAAVYGPGCDGELTATEVLGRIGDLEVAGALLGTWVMTPSACDLVEAAAKTVPTEASILAARCARGERGTVKIRSGRRTVELTSFGALTFLFDPAIAVESAAPLALAVRYAGAIEEARGTLEDLGVETELDLERARARGDLAAGAPE
jgi:hypothetical protein